MVADGYQDTDGSVAYIGRPAPRYLPRVLAPDQGKGQVDFGWNKAVPVSAPPASQIYSSPGA